MTSSSRTPGPRRPAWPDVPKSFELKAQGAQSSWAQSMFSSKTVTRLADLATAGFAYNGLHPNARNLADAFEPNYASLSENLTSIRDLLTSVGIVDAKAATNVVDLAAKKLELPRTELRRIVESFGPNASDEARAITGVAERMFSKLPLGTAFDETPGSLGKRLVVLVEVIRLIEASDIDRSHLRAIWENQGILHNDGREGDVLRALEKHVASAACASGLFIAKIAGHASVNSDGAVQAAARAAITHVLGAWAPVLNDPYYAPDAVAARFQATRESTKSQISAGLASGKYGDALSSKAGPPTPRSPEGPGEKA